MQQDTVDLIETVKRAEKDKEEVAQRYDKIAAEYHGTKEPSEELRESFTNVHAEWCIVHKNWKDAEIALENHKA